jgi:hypothetical protein
LHSAGGGGGLGAFGESFAVVAGGAAGEFSVDDLPTKWALGGLLVGSIPSAVGSH